MRTALTKTAIVGAAVVGITLAIGGGVASAHINPDPLAIEAGTSATIGFTIELGCDGSPTTSVTFQIPQEVTEIAPVDKDGWTATVSGGTIAFTGGPLPADEEGRFELTLTAPAQAGEVHFPTIQTCEQGELAWIEIAEEGAEEPEHPAPTLKITAGPPTSADLAPEAEESEDGAHEDGAAHEATAAAEATVAVVSATTPAGGSDDSSNTGAIVAVIVAAAVVLGGGGFLLARRRGSTTSS
jgi:uncharacterized protein YcnI